jgi:hypothetical protein
MASKKKKQEETVKLSPIESFFECFKEAYATRAKTKVKEQMRRDLIIQKGYKNIKDLTSADKKWLDETSKASWGITNCFEVFLDDCTSKRCELITHSVKTRLPVNSGSHYVPNNGNNHGYVSTDVVNTAICTTGKSNAMSKVLEKEIDGKRFYDHIFEDTDVAKQIIGQFGNYTVQDVKDLLKKNTATPVNSFHAAQVYLPTNKNSDNPDENYVILTVMPNVGVAITQDKLIRDYLYGGEKSKNPHGKVATRFFGDHPNAIVPQLANNRGYLQTLCCLPPKTSWRKATAPPQKNFFTENIKFYKTYKKEKSELYQHLTVFSKTDKASARKILHKIIVEILNARCSLLNSADIGWSEKATKLPPYQAIWLDDKRKSERITNPAWKQELAYQFAKLFGHYPYKKNEFIQKVFLKTLKARGGDI